ncbi:MAG: ABC-type polysaccharide/polyol phosphate transport system, ATPase component [Lacunisphaera sp.]|nr:ABC-type polysaccharide/polyol phosphate transport system, ATPase component [Lacunisphaera sp.]
MSDNPVISVKNVGKTYRIWKTPSKRLTVPFLEGLAGVLPPQSDLSRQLNSRALLGYHDFHALQDISIEIKRGESVGIIGRNGSGKSTLLQIIAGTLQASAGAVAVSGRVAALLELGSGFNPEFSGRENVHLNGLVLGLSRRQIESKFDSIAGFADIGDFIDQPVKTYSSGMTMRLAFAVQTAVEPDILIIDEALSVGDFFFSQKCMHRMRELRETGTTLLFVSHDMASIRDMTTRALLLVDGRARFFGETQRAISLYFDAAPARSGNYPLAAPAVDTSRIIQGGIETFLAKAIWRAPPRPPLQMNPRILGMAWQDLQGRPLTSLTLGQTARISLLLETQEAAAINIAIELKNRYDQIVCSLSTQGCALPAIELAAMERVRIDFEIAFNFEGGLYTVSGIVGHLSDQPNRGRRIDETPWLGPLKIEWDYEGTRAPFLGMFGPPVKASRHTLV